MTKDDVAACKAFMIERRLFGNNTEAELTKLDVKKLLEAKIRAESKTINERQEEENARKQIEIEPTSKCPSQLSSGPERSRPNGLYK